MTDLSPVRELLTAYRPHFAQADYRPALRWMEAGCDLERDILPVLRHWTTRKPDIYSLGFFGPHVMAAKSSREEAATKAAAATGPGAEARKARAIAYTVRRLGQRHPTDERWLAEYEARHGRVELQPASKEAV